MLPFPSYYGDGFPKLQGGSSMEMMGGGASNFSSRLTQEAKAIAASKNHSEAEKRRRERINGHLSTLRTLLPNTTKKDKASLLAEVVRQVKELKRQADEVVAQDGDASSSSNSGSSSSSGSRREWAFPGETDELTLGYCEAEATLVRAELCCDDRPELLTDLTKALRSVQAKVVKAEMATVGGRTKSVVVLKGVNGSGGGDGDLGALRKALKGVVDKPPLPALGQVLSGNKRPRLSRQLIANDF